MTPAGRRPGGLWSALSVLCLAAALLLLPMAPAAGLGDGEPTHASAGGMAQPDAHPCDGGDLPGPCGAAPHHCACCLVAVLAPRPGASAAGTGWHRHPAPAEEVAAATGPDVPHGPPRRA